MVSPAFKAININKDQITKQTGIIGGTQKPRKPALADTRALKYNHKPRPYQTEAKERRRVPSLFSPARMTYFLFKINHPHF